MAGENTVVTRDFYEKLLIAYRECPGNASFAARQALCDRRTAKRAWEKGWPNMKFQPIKDALEDESRGRLAAARKAVLAQQEAAEAARVAQNRETEEAKQQEKNMLKAARSDVLAALVLSADLIGAMRHAVNVIKRELEPGPDGVTPKISALQAMNLLARHATLIQKAVGAAEAVIQLSRLDRGATTANIGVGLAEEDLSPEAIDAELEAIAEVLAAGKANGHGHLTSNDRLLGARTHHPRGGE